MQQVVRILGVLVLVLAAAHSGAEVLSQPQPVKSDMPAPLKGSSKSLVTDQYGQPGKIIDPVGTPPIERWVYDGFTVYFENQHVVHSVKHKP